MKFRLLASAVVLCATTFAQQPAHGPESHPGESSSKDTEVDLSPPPGEAAPPASAGGDVNEMKPYDPHRAAKDVEVGEYHLSNKNYKGAEERFRDALEYKPRDTTATFRLAQTLDREDKLPEASEVYKEYLDLSPHGRYVADAKKALIRLKATESLKAKMSKPTDTVSSKK